jgi:hypothetical protein
MALEAHSLPNRGGKILVWWLPGSWTQGGRSRNVFEVGTLVKPPCPRGGGFRGPCPDFSHFTLAFTLQLRKITVKPQVRLADFDQTYTGSGAECGSATCYVCVSRLQREARYGQKTLLDSRVKCPSLLSDFDQSCTCFGTSGRSTICDISFTPLRWGARYSPKTLSSSRVSALR